MQIGENVHKIILTNLTFPEPVSITFYGMLPDEISESHSANYESHDIKSRSNPIQSYSGGSARSVPLSIDIHEDYLAEFNGGKADIREFVQKIKSITYPQYYGTQVVPPRVLLRVGDFLKIKGVCSSCDVSWKLPIRDGRYIHASISISIQEILSKSYSASEVFNGDDLRRM